MNRKVIITNIQRFSLHDGEGIRTTVFFKGCNLKCPWCANPENISGKIEQYIDDDKSVKKYGYEISLEQLEKEIIKDIKFYENGGGVTFSGGECLLQFKNIEPLLISLKEKKINICIETALSVESSLVDIALKYVDTFIIDLKILDKDEAKEKLNLDTELFFNNIDKIFKCGKDVNFRIPVVEEYTYTIKNIKLICDTLNKYNPKKIEIFSIHDLARKKYKLLKRSMFEEVNYEEDKLNKLKQQIEKNNIKVEICNL